MYQRILVAVDGSSTSEKALAEAITLALEGSGKLLLLHVSEEPLPITIDGEWGMMEIPPEIMAEAGERLLKRVLSVAHAAGVTAETRRVDALGRRVGPVIADVGREWEADLIVIGTHGRRGIDHLFLGSVAEAVIRVADMPVLLVRGA